MYTHDELIVFGLKQLKKWNCYPILTELVTWNNEIPDVIGWTCRCSILFECKASRSDFLADKKKVFRLNNSALGDFRFYLTNQDIVRSEEEVLPGWGVYEIINKKIVHKFGIRYDNCIPKPFEGNKNKEITMLRSFIRRLNESR